MQPSRRPAIRSPHRPPAHGRSQSSSSSADSTSSNATLTAPSLDTIITTSTSTANTNTNNNITTTTTTTTTTPPSTATTPSIPSFTSTINSNNFYNNNFTSTFSSTTNTTLLTAATSAAASTSIPSTIKLLAPTPTTPPMSAGAQGYFEPALTRTQSSQPSPTPPSAYAMQASYSSRKRSATAPSPASPPISTSNTGVIAATPTPTPTYSTPFSTSSPPTPHALPHPPQPQPTPPAPAYTVTTPVSAGKEKKESAKKKLFSKPARIGTPTMDKTNKPPPSPNKLASISSPMPWMTPSAAALAAAVSGNERKTSFSSMAGSTLTLVAAPGESSPFLHSSYSSSPPPKDHHSHKPHFLRPRRDKDHHHHHSGITFSSSSSNSKAISADGGSLYSFGPSSPSAAAFKSELKQSISGIDLSSAKKKSAAAAAAVAAATSWDDFDPTLVITADTAWPILCSRVIPLFKSESLTNTVEDLNKLVALHIRRCIELRNPLKIIDDVRDLLDSGMRLLDPGLMDPGLNDERSIPRLVDVWSTLFGCVLPYFEAVFLPLQRELRERGELFEVVGRGWDVRRLVLMVFRDSVVLPLFSRLRVLFSSLNFDFSMAQSDITHNAGRMLQCISVLSGVLTGDEAQERIDELAKTLKHNWLSRGRTGRNRRGFVGTRSVRAVVG